MVDDGHARKVVAIVGMPRSYALDVSVPLHVFGQHPGYRVAVCGDRDVAAVDVADEESTGVVSTTIHPTHTLDAIADADVVVVPGYAPPHLPLPEGHLAALRRAHERGARVVAVCTGVFALAAAGLLHGRTVTTHWRHADELRAACPTADVRDNRLLVEDGTILTSAGASAGIDACLHVVRNDFGATAADDVAKDVVSAPAREPTEPQYPDGHVPSRADLRATRNWVIGNIGSPITVQAMAERSNLSRRTFIRHFTTETGMPPMRWVLGQRIMSARRLLETSDRSIEQVAAATGFGTGANLRHIFRRETGFTPTAYRRSHAAQGAR